MTLHHECHVVISTEVPGLWTTPVTCSYVPCSNLGKVSNYYCSLTEPHALPNLNNYETTVDKLSPLIRLVDKPISLSTSSPMTRLCMFSHRSRSGRTDISVHNNYYILIYMFSHRSYGLVFRIHLSVLLCRSCGGRQDSYDMASSQQLSNCEDRCPWYDWETIATY